MNHPCPSLLFAAFGKWKLVPNSRNEKIIQRFASHFRPQKILVELHWYVSESINCERITVKTDGQFKQSRAVMNAAKVLAFHGAHTRCLCFSHGVIRSEYLCRRRVAHWTCIQTKRYRVKLHSRRNLTVVLVIIRRRGGVDNFRARRQGNFTWRVVAPEKKSVQRQPIRS